MTDKLAINGGPKACEVEWPSWPVWTQKDRKALLSVFDSGQWWYGEKVKEFEAKYAAFQDAKYGVTTTSGSTALEAAMLGLGIEAGDEVIVPPYTFMATAVSVVRVNAVPVFADIEGDTWCLDPADVERKITPRTKGIMPVHLGGYIADMDRLKKIARKHKLWILEDACHSWGGKWKGKGTGALGNAGVFSFQVSKNITSAEGGIVLSDNKDIAEDIRSYTNCGRRLGREWYEHAIAGTNLRMTEFQAALLLAQLSRLGKQTQKRDEACRFLDEELGALEGIQVARPERRLTTRACHLYTFRIDRKVLGVSREQFVEALNAEGASASPGYTTPLYQAGFFKHGKDAGRGCRPYVAAERDYAGVSCPVCEEVCRTTVWFKHAMLLAPKTALKKLVRTVRKVVENAHELAR